MPELLQNVAELPDQYGRIAASFRSTAVLLARASGTGLAQGILPTNVFIRSGRMNTRLVITRQQGDLWFGFRKSAEQTDVLLDTTVSFRIETAERDFDGLLLAPESVVLTAIAPSFLVSSGDAEDPAGAANTLRATLAEILFLRLDFGMLAVAEPGDIRRARVAWKRPGMNWEAMVVPLVGGDPRRWQVAPFLALGRTIGVWIRRGFEEGEPRPISLPTEPDEQTEKTALYLLRHLVGAWVSAVNRLGNRTGEPETSSPAVAALAPDYDIWQYEAQVVLRLDPIGQLARKGERDDLFQLQATLRADEDEGGVPRCRVAIGPPDFLAAGDLYEEFLDRLEEAPASTRIAEELGLAANPAPVQSFIKSARASAQDAPLVFRVKQGKRDTDLITLHGTLNGLLQHVVLRVEVTVDPNADRSVEIDAKRIDVLYTDRPIGGGPSADEAKEMIEYFLRLINLIHRWQGAMR